MYIILGGTDKIKISSDDAGTDLSWRSGWTPGEIYKIYDLISHNDIMYICEVGHRSDILNEPGTGRDWKTYWSEWGLSGGRIAGDEIKLGYIPANYIPDGSVPEAKTDPKSLSAHLAGISNKFSQLTGSSSSEWKGEVGNINLLPLTGNTVGDKRAVSDGNAWLIYRCKSVTGSLNDQWEKILRVIDCGSLS